MLCGAQQECPPPVLIQDPLTDTLIVGSTTHINGSYVDNNSTVQCFWSGPDATLSDVTQTNSSDMDVPYTTKNSSDTTNSSTSDLDVSYASGNSSDSDSSGLNAYTDFNTSEFENTTTSTTHNFNETTDTNGNESIIVTEATECSRNDGDMTYGSTVTEADMTYSGSSSGGSACCGDDVVELCFTLAVTVLGGEGRGEIFCNITCGDLHNSSATISYDIISKEGVYIGSFSCDINFVLITCLAGEPHSSTIHSTTPTTTLGMQLAI